MWKLIFHNAEYTRSAFSHAFFPPKIEVNIISLKYIMRLRDKKKVANIST